MQISAAVRERALLDLFELYASIEEQALSFVTLRNGWTYTGLRDIDLQRAADDLQQSGCAVAVATPQGPALRLTKLGQAFLQSQPRDARECREQLRIRGLLSRAARRTRSGRLLEARRRASDHALAVG